jgi:hypothetical protein
LIGASTFLILFLLLEVNSAADRILQAATRRVFSLAWKALEILVT